MASRTTPPTKEKARSTIGKVAEKVATAIRGSKKKSESGEATPRPAKAATSRAKAAGAAKSATSKAKATGAAKTATAKAKAVGAKAAGTSKAKSTGTKAAAPKSKTAGTKAAKSKVAAEPKAPRAKRIVPATGPEHEAALAAAKIAADAALDKKAEDVVILDVAGLNSYADCFVVASGTSDRQVSAIATSIEEKMKKEGHLLIGVEGTGLGHWILLDYGDVVIHVFYDEVRAHYDVEGLWADAKRIAVG